MDDPFAIFDLPYDFALDEADLQRRFIDAIAVAHPDRFPDPLDQADAVERAAQINQAYDLLSDPESRANALLICRGGQAKEQDKSLPPDLLMEMMEIREQMETAIAANDLPALKKHRRWANEQRQAHLERIVEHFAAAGPGPIDDTRGRAIRLELNALRYIERMREQMPGE